MINVMDYINAGKTIQMAEDDLYNAMPWSGGRLFFPAGVYIPPDWIVKRPNILWEAEALGAVTLKAKDGLNKKFIVNQAWLANSGYDENIIFDGFIFDMNGANQTDSNPVTISRTRGHQVRNCKFINPRDCLYMLTGSPVTDENIDAYYDAVRFIGTGATYATDVVDIGGGTNIRMSRIHAFDAKAGSGSSMLSIAIIDGFSITDSYLDGNGNGAPLVLYGIRGGKVDAEIRNSKECGIRVQNWAEVGPLKAIDGVEIAGNIHDNDQDGVWINHAGTMDRIPKNIKVSAQIWNNGRAAVKANIVDGLKITGSDIHDNSKAGVGQYPVFDFNGAFSATPHVNNIRIWGNRIYRNGSEQTKLFDLDWVDNLNFYDNDVSGITTISTETNSSNVSIMADREEQQIVIPFDVVAGSLNKFIALLDANYSRKKNFAIDRVSLRLETIPGSGESVVLSVSNGVSTAVVSASGGGVADNTINCFLWMVASQDLTIKYTATGGCNQGKASLSIVGHEQLTV